MLLRTFNARGKFQAAFDVLVLLERDETLCRLGGDIKDGMSVFRTEELILQPCTQADELLASFAELLALSD